MAYGVNQLCIDIQNNFTDCTTAEALRLTNKVLGDFMQTVPGFVQTETINLTSGTRFYALANEYGKVDSCTLVKSATSAVSLIDTSMAEQDEMYRGYRGVENAAGDPTHYSITTGANTAYTHPVKLYVYLYPTPDTTTSGGYPSLRLTGSAHVALVTSDSLPNYILDPYWLEEEVCARLAARARDWGQVQARKAIAKEMREAQMRSLVNIQSRQPLHIDTPMLSGGDRTF